MPEFIALMPLSRDLILLIVVLVIKGVISCFSQYQPLRFFQLYCSQLADKVNRVNNSIQQQTLAGCLALFITMAPIVIILWLFADFVAVDILWQGLLLYLALGTISLGKITKSIAQALVANKTYIAKKLLRPWLLRDIQLLSTLGLSKATIEMQLLRVTQQVYVVCFIYLCAGALAALSYRLLLEIHYCWNTKLTQFHYFGLFSQRLVKILQWLPSRLMALLMLIANLESNRVLFWRLTRIYFFKLNDNFVIATHALVLGVQLGGVAMYNEQKLRKIAFNDLAKQPEPRDIIIATAKINFCLYASLVLLIVVTFCYEIFSLML
jgi:adenosylcobinamide-phosphate synthase